MNEVTGGPALITGGHGMLAAALLERLGPSACAFGRHELDVTDRVEVRTCMTSIRPSVVFNCAAWTDVDGAEAQPAAADQVNRRGVELVVEAADEIGARVVHFSTDYVFGGDRRGQLYAPLDNRNPRSVYGQTKAAGEDAMLSAIAAGGRHLIIRTSWLYGAGGPNFVETMARLGREREVLRVVDDQWGRPTWTRDLAEAAVALASRVGAGVFHVAGRGITTWHEFAVAVVRGTGGGARVEGVSSEEWAAAAPRPVHSVLDLAQTEQALGCRFDPWAVSLERYLRTRASHA